MICNTRIAVILGMIAGAAVSISGVESKEDKSKE